MKKVFGFVGHVGCGKGVACEYAVKKYGASTYRFSTMLRDILDRLYIAKNRVNLIQLSEILRHGFGEDTMAHVIKNEVDADAHELICVDGIRRLADIGELKKLPHFVLVHIVASPEIRYKRIIARTENVGDTTKTFEQFLQEEQLPTELSIDEVAAKATLTISNNGTVMEFEAALNKLICER